MDSPRAVAMRTLRVDALTAEVLRALEDAGCRSILLKGPSFRRELYDAGSPRPYADSDLLVSPADLERAGAAVAALGFRLAADALGLPASGSPRRRLLAASPAPGSFGLLRIVESGTLRERARALRGELLPAPAFMRARRAGGPRPGLAGARLPRAPRLARLAPAGRRARRGPLAASGTRLTSIAVTIALAGGASGSVLT
ncbi:MAG: nucleotidyltransferase family protein [Thermoleophilaceae bacterium]